MVHHGIAQRVFGLHRKCQAGKTCMNGDLNWLARKLGKKMREITLKRRDMQYISRKCEEYIKVSRNYNRFRILFQPLSAP
jgi:hypothetical protein